MTIPATARPTPAALARRPAPKPRTPAESIAPGELVGKERMRTMIERGMRISRLHPEARLVALTLLGYAHHKTGVVFPASGPRSSSSPRPPGSPSARSACKSRS